MLKSSSLLCAVSSGILAGLAYCHAALPVPSVLILVAYVPLLWAIASVEDKRHSMVWPLYLCFFLYHGICNWWISSWQEQTDPYLMASGIAVWFVHPLLLMLPWAVLEYLSRKLSVASVLVLTPFVVTGFEWLHGLTDFSYPWLTSGYAIVDLPLAQVADVTGVYGLTFLIMVANVLAVLAIQRRAQGYSWRGGLATFLGFCAVWTSIGHLNRPSRQSYKTVTVALVQPNINPWDKWSAPSEQLRVHLSVTDSLYKSGLEADVTIWSETAIPYVIRNYRYLGDWLALRGWVDSTRTSLITGFADMMVYPNGEAPASARSLSIDPGMKYDHFNAAMVLNPSARDVPVHRKTMLTPFAERLPFAEQLSFAMKWVEWGVGISAWGKGRERTPLPVLRSSDTLARIGTVICIESIYPDVARDMVNNGADVLAVITNDAWYNGTWGPRQHYDIARMRAIEMRRPVVRCANSGVSGIIDAEGASIMELPELQRLAAIGMVHPRTEKTFYARYGDWLPSICLVLTLFAVVVARITPLLRILPAPFLRQSSHNPQEE